MTSAWSKWRSVWAMIVNTIWTSTSDTTGAQQSVDSFGFICMFHTHNQSCSECEYKTLSVELKVKHPFPWKDLHVGWVWTWDKSQCENSSCNHRGVPFDSSYQIFMTFAWKNDWICHKALQVDLDLELEAKVKEGHGHLHHQKMIRETNISWLSYLGCFRVPYRVDVTFVISITKKVGFIGSRC